MGNFDPELISCRSTGFESLLDHIARESKMREAASTIEFFQNAELFEAKKFMREKKYDQALFLFENSFKLLNKVRIIYVLTNFLKVNPPSDETIIFNL